MECDHSLESYWTELYWDTVCFTIQRGSNIFIFGSNHAVWSFFEKLPNSNVLQYFWLCSWSSLNHAMWREWRKYITSAHAELWIKVSCRHAKNKSQKLGFVIVLRISDKRLGFKWEPQLTGNDLLFQLQQYQRFVDSIYDWFMIMGVFQMSRCLKRLSPSSEQGKGAELWSESRVMAHESHRWKELMNPFWT